MAETGGDDRAMLLKLAARGLSIREASQETGLSVEAVRKHWYCVEFREKMRKLRRRSMVSALPKLTAPIENALEQDRRGLEALKTEAIKRAMRSLQELIRLTGKRSALSGFAKARVHLALLKLALETPTL